MACLLLHIQQLCFTGLPSFWQGRQPVPRWLDRPNRQHFWSWLDPKQDKNKFQRILIKKHIHCLHSSSGCIRILEISYHNSKSFFASGKHQFTHKKNSMKKKVGWILRGNSLEKYNYHLKKHNSLQSKHQLCHCYN